MRYLEIYGSYLMKPESGIGVDCLTLIFLVMHTLVFSNFMGSGFMTSTQQRGRFFTPMSLLWQIEKSEVFWSYSNKKIQKIY